MASPNGTVAWKNNIKLISCLPHLLSLDNKLPWLNFHERLNSSPLKSRDWPTQPLIQRTMGALSPRVKQLGYEVDHSLPSTAKEAKNEWSYTSTPPICHDVYRHTFTFAKRGKQCNAKF
jgi:hypothetical protein